MKKLFFLAPILFLVACGGGGGGSTVPSTPNAPPGPSSPPAPTPSPTPIVANLNLPYYLPLRAGNTWTFQTGGRIVDQGAGPVACACPVNGQSVEILAIVSPNAVNPSGYLYIKKESWPLSGPLFGHHLTNIAAVSNDGVTLIFTFYSFDGSFFGVPIIDDTPAQGEFFQVSALNGTGSGQVTILSVGGTQSYGTEIIDSIAISSVTSNALGSELGSGTVVQLGFAPGVGFTSVMVNGQSTTLANFSVSMQSQSHTVNKLEGEIGAPNYNVLEHLFK